MPHLHCHDLEEGRGQKRHAVTNIMSASSLIVLQKSPSRLCEIEICNNRIGASVLLNHCCSFVLDLESMFRDQMPKILLQHNRGEADFTHQAAARNPAVL